MSELASASGESAPSLGRQLERQQTTDVRSRPRATASWEALGSTVVVKVADPQALMQARSIVRERLDEVDRACSRFRADSELTLVNAQAGRRVEVSPLLAEAVSVALRAAELTGGLVDPTIGAALVAAGYDRDWQLVRARGEQQGTFRAEQTLSLKAFHRNGWRTVELFSGGRELCVPTGIELDLGATAKAWAADTCALAVAKETGSGALVSLGGDVALSGRAPARGWLVHVSDDHRDDPSRGGESVLLDGGGLATSSTSVRRWTQGSRLMHHIIDPDTGAPASTRWRTATVAARCCTDANIASTAAILLSDAAPAWLSARHLPARLVATDGTVVNVGGWPSRGSRAARPEAAA